MYDEAKFKAAVKWLNKRAEMPTNRYDALLVKELLVDTIEDREQILIDIELGRENNAASQWLWDENQELYKRNRALQAEIEHLQETIANVKQALRDAEKELAL